MRFYTNDILFEIRDSKDKLGDERGYIPFGSISPEGIWERYCMARDGQVQGRPKFLFYVSKYKKTVKFLDNKFKEVHAAGGIVEKDENVLFIYRLEKWDLPKGHVEKGEDFSETAVREVEEECGITVNLGIKIGETWHTYVHKDRDVLKCTHWYKMTCKDDTTLKPQVEESIEEVKWIDKSKVSETVLKDTYASIREIYEEFERM